MIDFGNCQAESENSVAPRPILVMGPPGRRPPQRRQYDQDDEGEQQQPFSGRGIGVSNRHRIRTLSGDAVSELRGLGL